MHAPTLYVFLLNKQLERRRSRRKAAAAAASRGRRVWYAWRVCARGPQGRAEQRGGQWDRQWSEISSWRPRGRLLAERLIHQSLRPAGGTVDAKVLKKSPLMKPRVKPHQRNLTPPTPPTQRSTVLVTGHGYWLWVTGYSVGH